MLGTNEGKPASVTYLLAKELADKVAAAISSGQLVKTKALFIARKVTQFDYKEGNVSFGISYKQVEREEWRWKDELSFVENVAKQSPHYAAASKMIMQELK